MKPKPPSQNAIDDDLAIALRNLGVASCEDVVEVVFSGLVAHWKKHKQPPTMTGLADSLSLSRAKVAHAFSKLVTAKRVLHVRKGIYVPKV